MIIIGYIFDNHNNGYIYNGHIMDIWLVVLTILKNMKVNGKDDIPCIMENNPNV
jgi:surface polysaccharide O-acyltransferase-like enzyme